MFGFGKNKGYKKDKATLDKFQADYVHALTHLAFDYDTQLKHIFEQYPMLKQYSEGIKMNVVALQRCAVFFYIRTAHGNSDWAHLVNEMIDNESILSFIRFEDYTDTLEPLLQLPEYTTLSDSFVEVAGRIFRDSCGEKAMTSCDALAELGSAVYRNTYTSCLNWLTIHEIR